MSVCSSVCLSVQLSVRLSTFWLTSAFKLVLGHINPLPIVSFGSKWIHPDVIDKCESGLSPRKIFTCECVLHYV